MTPVMDPTQIQQIVQKINVLVGTFVSFEKQSSEIGLISLHRIEYHCIHVAVFLIIVFGKDAKQCKKRDRERFQPITSNWEDCNNASKALKVKEICTDAIGSVEGNVSICASNVSLAKGCIEYEENKVSFSLAGMREPSGRERILCKGNKNIDYIFPVDLKHVPPFVNMLVIFDVHIKVCAGNKGICVTVADCCCTKGICGKDDCCLNSNDVEVKCVDVYYHKQ